MDISKNVIDESSRSRTINIIRNIYITAIETEEIGDRNYCTTKEAAHETEINNTRTLYLGGIKSVRTSTHGLIEIIQVYAYQAKQQNKHVNNMQVYINQITRFNTQVIGKITLQTRYGVAHNNINRLTDSIDAYFRYLLNKIRMLYQIVI